MAKPLLSFLLAAVLGALALAAPGPARAAGAPVLPGEYPDPSVVAHDGRYVATATSNRWAPVFPVLVSDDLVSWRQAGSVYERAPRWATGRRFWAPELTVARGRLLVVYAALKRNGQWCIGAATAARAAGPWRDRGPVLCRPGGAIDPAVVTGEDGDSYLVYKAKGVGGGLYARPLDLRTLRTRGPATRLLEPQRGDRGVTEAPALLRRDGWWYMFFSSGNCCGPPCTYTERVARSQSLLGPYTRLEEPVLRDSADWRCPGHGTPVELDDGRVALLHHGYRFADEGNRRRVGLLSLMSFGTDGWPAAQGGPVDAAAPAALGAEPAPAPDRLADDFAGRELSVAWQWMARTSVPQTRVAGRRLDLGCGPYATITRQVGADRFEAAVTVRPAPGRDGIATLGIHERGGVLRGVEIRDGTARAVRRNGDSVKLGTAVRVPRDDAVRVRVTALEDGALRAEVRRGGRWVRVAGGLAARGDEPTRVALACRGSGRTARFTALRVEGATPGVALAVQPAAGPSAR
ncbi:MAG: family 43 glycosylhydrolase [Solirubrobacteraceae bacterium MAG38_C4-C5]|nr:family 43 glycosylhydrolase [Candidatus Siliceabacter maunaloa]